MFCSVKLRDLVGARGWNLHHHSQNGSFTDSWVHSYPARTYLVLLLGFAPGSDAYKATASLTMLKELILAVVRRIELRPLERQSRVLPLNDTTEILERMSESNRRYLYVYFPFPSLVHWLFSHLVGSSGIQPDPSALQTVVRSSYTRNPLAFPPGFEPGPYRLEGEDSNPLS